MSDSEVYFNPDMFLPSEFSVQTLIFDRSGAANRFGTIEKPDEVGDNPEPAPTASISDNAVTIRLTVTNSATTDWDLTGVIVWPVSRLLGWFVLENQSVFASKIVWEVGAGCGATGVVASRFAKEVVLTDGQDLVIEMLRSTSNLRQFESYAEQVEVLGKESLEVSKEDGEEKIGGLQSEGVDSNNIKVCKLFWGSDESVNSFLSQSYEQADIVIGADVFHPSFGEPLLLFQTLKTLRQDDTKSLKFYCGFVQRGAGNRHLVLDAAESTGFTVIEHSTQSFLPADVAASEMSQRNMCVFEFELPAVAATAAVTTK